MITAALTGSIAMGKSETARMFARRGIPVFDSDAAVHELYANGGEAVAMIERLAPDTIVNGAVDRKPAGGEDHGAPGTASRDRAGCPPFGKVKAGSVF